MKKTTKPKVSSFPMNKITKSKVAEIATTLEGIWADRRSLLQSA